MTLGGDLMLDLLIMKYQVNQLLQNPTTLHLIHELRFSDDNFVNFQLVFEPRLWFGAVLKQASVEHKAFCFLPPAVFHKHHY